jgi:hypothetical protein
MVTVGVTVRVSAGAVTVTSAVLEGIGVRVKIGVGNAVSLGGVEAIFPPSETQ